MPFPSKQKAIEEREGKAMSQILQELYQIHGKQIDVARALGVTTSTISLWVKLSGLEEKTILVPRKREEVRIIDDRPQIAAAHLPSIQRAE